MSLARSTTRLDFRRGEAFGKQIAYARALVSSAGLGGGKKNVGMEGFLYYVRDKKTGNITLNWKGFLSDWTQQGQSPVGSVFPLGVTQGITTYTYSFQG